MNLFIYLAFGGLEVNLITSFKLEKKNQRYNTKNLNVKTSMEKFELLSP